MNSIPVNWALCRLGEICSKPQYGWTCKATKAGKLRIVRTSDISRGNVDWETLPFCGRIPEHLDKYKLGRDDILVSRAGSVGVSVRVDCMPCDAVYASYLIRFRPLDGVNPKYLEFYLKSQDYWNAISELSAGIAVPNVNASKLSKLIIPIAPLHEQHRIAAKLEELLAKVEKCKERLERIPAILKRFRHSILAAAYAGRLTETWRSRHPAVETAKGLLRRIQLDYNDRYTAECAEAKRKRSKKPVKPALLSLKTVEKHDEHGSWATIKVDHAVLPGDLFDGPFGSNLKTSDYAEKGVRVIRLENIGFLNFLEEHRTYISDEKYATLTKHTVRQGDLVFASFVADVVRTTVLPKVETAIAKADCFCLRPIPDLLNVKYLAFVLSSPQTYSHLNASAHGATRPRVNTAQLRNLSMPLPPFDEQQAIVHRVEALFKIADQIEARYKKAKAVVDKLSQSILAKAFRGELVPQDPNDEPASELLERIREERSKRLATSRIGRT